MTNLETRPLEGTLRFIRYAFMPNRLRYCGGDDNRTLFEYGVEEVTDGGLQPLLRKFSGALPHLQLIARANGLRHPFDTRAHNLRLVRRLDPVPLTSPGSGKQFLIYP
jgi:hypothetical protein